MGGFRWTNADIAILRCYYGRWPAARIASAVGRTLRSVFRQANLLGLAKTIRHTTSADHARIAELAQQGLCNRCIGREIGLSRGAVRKWRARLGVPPVASGGSVDSCLRCKERVRVNTREQLARCGAKSLGEVRVMAFRKYACDAGWPEDLRPRAVQILNLLYHEGPKTRKEIAAAIGMPWKGSRKSLHSNDREGSYLAHLIARGLVVCLGRCVRGRGKGLSTCRYAVPVGVGPSYGN